MPYLIAADDVNTDYFTDNYASGGDGGDSFTFIKLAEGAALKRIQVWKENWRFRGVKVWMTDGSSMLVGHESGDSGEFSFGSEEFITHLNIQASGTLSNDKKHRVGAIKFETNLKRSWEITSNDLKKDGEYLQEVGSGICCGIFGAAGWDVDRLGFAMLRKIKSSVLKNVTYPNLAKNMVATQPETVAQEIFSNGTDREQTFNLSGSKAVTTTREWSISSTLSFAHTVTVNAGVPMVAEGKTTSEWSLSVTGSYSQSSTTSETKSWDWPLVCPPRRRTLGIVTLYEDEISTEYNADLELHLDNGKVYTYKEKGMYNGINARMGQIKVTDEGPYDGK